MNAGALLSRIGLPAAADAGPALHRADAALRRLAALAWLAAAIVTWARIMGVLPVDGTLFFLAAPPVQAKTVAFAVVYPVAAVGMWLLSAWGLVVWLIAIAAQIVLLAVFGSAAGVAAPTVAGNLLAAAVVLAVAVSARRYPRVGKR